MQVVKNLNSEYPIGILWNMGNKYAREMMLKIAIMEDVLQVKILDLGQDYEQFVLDCYQGDEEAPGCNLRCRPEEGENLYSGGSYIRNYPDRYCRYKL